MEARLLRSSPGFEPPAHAQEEVWRRLKGLGAVGAAAGALGLGAHTAAAAAKVAGNALWVWVAGGALAATVAATGVSTYWAVQHRTAKQSIAVVAATPAPPATGGDVTADPPVPGEAAQTSGPVTEAPRRDLSRSRPLFRAPSSALRGESLLLAAARAKLAAGDASGALEDVARAAAQFPHGKLVQEREVVAIDCLSALGDRAGTRARALAFRERFPNSPYIGHVRQLLAP